MTSNVRSLWFRQVSPRQVLLALMAGVSLLCLSDVSQAEQFVLFDTTFTMTKEDADKTKSHFYLKGDALNPQRPKDWTSPIDYRNGTVHIRMEVLDKPKGNEANTWSLCYIPYKGQKNNYGCTGSPTYKKPGVYEMDVPMTKFWENDSIIWTEGIKEMHLVIKDTSGGQGHAHKRADHEKFFPTKVRIMMIQVSAGSKYDPKAVPGLDAK